MPQKSRVTILVKASPQPSNKHQETVCCAGLSEDGKWKRLFPIQFRRMQGSEQFHRWDIVEFEHVVPRDDKRAESCKVIDGTTKIVGKTKTDPEKFELVQKAIVSSEVEAAHLGHSLALIQPSDPSLHFTKLSASELSDLREKYKRSARQLYLFEDELPPYEPCPYVVKMRFTTIDGKTYNKTCADWETSAAFFNLRREYNEADIIKHLKDTYCQKYVEKGLTLALGNIAKRPHTWQLLGIFPVKLSNQLSLL